MDLFEEPALPSIRSQHDHIISLDEDSRPPFRNPFRLSTDEATELHKQLEALIDEGFIRLSNSVYGAPVLLAKRKGWGHKALH